MLFGLFGSYEFLNKEDNSPFLIAKFSLSWKSSFGSFKVKKAFETLTELIWNLLNWWRKSTMIYKKKTGRLESKNYAVQKQGEEVVARLFLADYLNQKYKFPS